MTGMCMTSLVKWILVYMSTFICHAGSAPSNPDNADNLVQINVIFRHGARTPHYRFPNSAFPITATPLELTTNGMKQSYSLGKLLRKRYISGHPFRLLFPTYKNFEILVNSSMTSRTMESAYCLLAGLYPPQGEQIWNPDLLWQPIPVYTRDPKDDLTCNVPSGDTCPYILDLYSRELESEELAKLQEQNKDFFEYLDEMCGFEQGYTDLSVVAYIGDTLFMEREEGILSPWADEDWRGNTSAMDQINQLYPNIFAYRYLNGDLMKLFGGILLGDVINNMKNSNERSTKAFFYSAHEEKLGPILSCFNLFQDDFLPLNVSSVMVFELYKSNEQHGVKLAYKDGHQEKFKYLNVPGCGTSEYCPLEELARIAEPCVPTNWREMCRQTKATNN